MAEFTANIANLGKYSAGVLTDTTLSFPTTKEQVQAALREIGVDGLRYQEIIILEYSIGVNGVGRICPPGRAELPCQPGKRP